MYAQTSDFYSAGLWLHQSDVQGAQKPVTSHVGGMFHVQTSDPPAPAVSVAGKIGYLKARQCSHHILSAKSNRKQYDLAETGNYYSQ